MEKKGRNAEQPLCGEGLEWPQEGRLVPQGGSLGPQAHLLTTPWHLHIFSTLRISAKRPRGSRFSTVPG